MKRKLHFHYSLGGAFFVCLALEVLSDVFLDVPSVGIVLNLVTTIILYVMLLGIVYKEVMIFVTAMKDSDQMWKKVSALRLLLMLVMCALFLMLDLKLFDLQGLWRQFEPLINR